MKLPIMNNLSRIGWAVACLAVALTAHAREFHVAINGNNTNSGTASAPLRTIQRAAELAQPGDVITVHEGVYRERINPPRGGTSDRQRIVYQAAPGEKVEIKGSEVVKGWTRVEGDIWKVTLPKSFFGHVNPFKELIDGDWFNPKNREHHTGAVYLNGDWLTEAAKLDEVLTPDGKTPLWFGKAEAESTTLWAQFQGVNPNEQLVEINVRRTVFYPDQPARNFITVRGFTLRHAATPWAPPTSEQIGLIGTHWSKGWIIESNVISHSVCVGVTLGKHGDEFDNTSADTAVGYVETIRRAHVHPFPWTKENIGHHIVRDNHISFCEQAGIVGSLGCAFSTITGNTIHDIHVRGLFSGAEQAGIKFHAAIDTEISRNHVYRTTRGLWLDWMAQGTRVTQNLFHDNGADDLFVEVDHGPFVVDNNLFLSRTSLQDWSQGGAYIHNLMTGRISCRPELGRDTPFHPAHSTAIAGLTNIQGGDNRFFNNIFVGTGEASSSAPADKSKKRGYGSGYGLWVYDESALPLQTGGNIYFNGARPHQDEPDAVVVAEKVTVNLEMEKSGQTQLQFSMPVSLGQAATKTVTTKSLGLARIPNLPYKDADGSQLKVNTDYFGQRRDSTPTAGPFENPGSGPIRLTEPSGKLGNAKGSGGN
jgi:alpha-N-arabinofuranosidase